MKNYFAPAAVLLALIAVAATLRPARNATDYDIVGFSRLPALVNGRVKPLDTVARTSLLVLQGRQRVTAPDGRSLAPTEWLLDAMFRPAVADEYQTFEIVHPDVLALMNVTTADGAGGKRFSFHQLAKGLAELDRQAKLADDTESAVRTPFQRAVIQLRDGIVLYQRLQNTLNSSGSADFLERLEKLKTTAEPGAVMLTDDLARELSSLDTFGYFRAIPPAPGADATAWKTAGAAWSESRTAGAVPPAALVYVALGRAWQLHQPPAFNNAVAAFRRALEVAMPGTLARCDVEARFNSAQPFYTAMSLYVIAFLLAVVSWLKWPEACGRTAFWLVGIAFVVSTVGIAARMWLEARPPVTNLYSSALFVGWGAVALCLWLEFFYKNAIGSVAAGLIGFATLVIAHHLALGGDTMEMMRAVLDSNFWLATHVVTVTVGYSATFLAGFLALIYVLRGTLTRSLSQPTADALAKMIYGTVCFATLFSFVGTVLGGIWADQSWGRFWGWDPKENGALLIVIWNSVILHTRWGGLVKQRGLAMLAIFGNIVTAWSWFGVNMLGVGLHSYGFMDSAFWWLVAFGLTQLAVIALAALPTEKWKSFRPAAA